MGSVKTGESNSYSGSGQRWATGPAKRGVANVMDVYDQNAGNLRGISSTVNNSLFQPLTDKFSAGSATAGQGRQYYGDVLSGKYLNGNPNLDAMFGNISRDVSNNVNSQAQMAGRYGSDAHYSALTRGLAEADTNLRYNDYNNERGRMDGAAQGAIASNNADASQALAASGVAAELPYTGTNNMANSLAALFNGGNSNSVSYGPNPIFGALGAGLGAAGSIWGGKSDRRLKKDIVALGVRNDGLTEYEWTYRNDPEAARYRGVMADEVKELRPEAYIEDFNGSGYAGVNYAALGTPMLKLAA